MKRKLFILTISLSALSLVACNNGITSLDEFSVPDELTSIDKMDSSSEIKDAVDIYLASISKMKDLTYEVNSFGESITDVSGNGHPLKDHLLIYENLKHKDDELYFEKISNGKPVFGAIGVSFAQKAYIKGDSGRRASASTVQPWKPFDQVNPKDSYPIVDNYGVAYDKEAKEILNEFGKIENNYLGFAITHETVHEQDLAYKTLADGYELNFDLVIDNGIDSLSIAGYKNQVYTMSGKKLKSVESIKLTINLDKEFKVKNYVSREKYTVDTFSAKIDNTLTYEFSYFNSPSDLKIESF